MSRSISFLTPLSSLSSESLKSGCSSIQSVHRSSSDNASSAGMQAILVISDDASLREKIALMLNQEWYRPLLVSDYGSGIRQALSLKPDLVLLDLQLQGVGTAEVCAQLRAKGLVAPLIVLNAVCAEEEKVRVLDNGADDYIIKPFGLRELLARIHAVLRRASADNSMTIRFGDVEVNLPRRVVLKRGEELELTRTEFNLLTFFLRNPDRTLERDLILNLVWGYEWFRQMRTLDSHVGKLRKKLETDVGNPSHFLTVHGVGYRFLP